MNLIHPAVLAALVASPVAAGPFSGPTDTIHPIDPAIAASSDAFVAWANDILDTGTRFAPRGSTVIDESGGFNSLGDLDETDIANNIAPGRLTVGFPVAITNDVGPDFAVFENGFVFPSDPFLNAELAYVEVSTNGSDFARFPSVSTNTTFQGTFGQSFGGFDTTNINNLAGKHAGGFGTGFDLVDLQNDPLVVSGQVDLGEINFVRLVDIPGNGAFTDSLGNPILDAWLTEGSGGFDFALGEGTGVGILNAVPEPASISLLAAAGVIGLRRRR